MVRVSVGTWHTSLYSTDGGIAIFHEHGLPGSLGLGQPVGLTTEFLRVLSLMWCTEAGRTNQAAEPQRISGVGGF